MIPPGKVASSRFSGIIGVIGSLGGFDTMERKSEKETDRVCPGSKCSGAISFRRRIIMALFAATWIFF